MSLAKGKIRQMEAMQERKAMEPPPPRDPQPPQDKSQDKIEFVPGVIVRFVLGEPVLDNGKAYKARLRAAVMEPVKYVDAINGQLQMHVRCVSAKQAETISGAGKSIVGVPGEILKAHEETSYWEKIRKDRQDKVSGKVPKTGAKRMRGKDRLVKKYEETVRNTHRFFDDDD